MKKISKISNIAVLAILMALLAISTSVGVSYHKRYKSALEALKMTQEAYQDSISTYKVRINGLEETVAQQGVIILSQRDAIKTGLLERERLRKLNIKTVRENTELKAKINVLKDSLALPHETEVVYVNTQDTSFNALKLPATLSYYDNYLKLKVDIKKDMWDFESLSVVPLNLTVGGSKVVVTTPNPYVKITDIKTVVVPQKVKLKDRRWMRWVERSAIAATFFYLGSR